LFTSKIYLKKCAIVLLGKSPPDSEMGMKGHEKNANRVGFLAPDISCGGHRDMGSL